jgi:hypothetical protein
LIFVAVLVPAAQGQGETLVLHGEIAAPVFDRKFFGLDPALSELLGQILGEPLPPEPGLISSSSPS